MSIVAMKRKALRKPLSSGSSGFSINGGYRNSGGITRTPVLSRSGYKCSANDSSIVKPSVISTKGYLAKKIGCSLVDPSCNVVASNPVHNPKKDCILVDTGDNIGTTSCSETSRNDGSFGCRSSNNRTIVVKNQNRTVSQGDYLERKKNRCRVSGLVKPNNNLSVF